MNIIVENVTNFQQVQGTLRMYNSQILGFYLRTTDGGASLGGQMNERDTRLNKIGFGDCL